MSAPYVNIHTHRPTGRGIELRTAGIHPWDAATQTTDVLFALSDGIQAVGEIGLDFACEVPRDVQLRVLREQLTWADRLRLPVVLHCVRAFEPIMKELQAHTLRGVIFHGFIGSCEQARRAVEAGYYLSIGERTLRSSRTVDALRRMPLDRLFCETDDSPTPIEEIYSRSAAALGIDEKVLQDILLQNYKRIFTPNNDR